MNEHQNMPRAPHPRGRTTEEFAAEKLVKPQTVRKRYSQTGSYFGTIPKRLENGRLRWP